ncbi:hypothetical protein RhiJN_22524 [Ceratobasidium sp. AG-Ba]|nr:hypothetical protein RhiJN_22524 [Ceratobasidium sp. AG-Ba]
MATKTLNFYTYNLQKDTTVMLMFQPPSNAKLFKDQFPVVWKIITFRAGGHAKAVVRYCARLAFGYAQTDDDNLVDSAAWVEVKSGDITSVTGDYGVKRFGAVSKREGTRLLVCKNNTKERANLSIGFVRGDLINQRYEPTLPECSPEPNPTSLPNSRRFLPQSQLLRGEVETDPIWSQDLNMLDDVSSWNFVEDGASGEFFIRRADQL